MSPSSRIVLAATDFSTRGNMAVHRAARLARASHCRLQVLHVVQGLGSTPWWSQTRAPDEDDALVRRTREQLDALVQQVREQHGIEAEGVQRRGSIATCVAEQAASGDARLVVVGATGAGALVRRLLGSSTQSILRSTGRAVLVVRRQADADYARVLFATDFSQTAQRAIEEGLALTPNAATAFLTALDASPDSHDLRLGVTDSERAEALQAARDAARDRLGTLAATLGHDGAAIIVRDGRPSEEVPRSAQAFEADLVCLGAQGHSALERLVLGSTSAHAVAEVECDVLVVPAAEAAS